MSEPTGRGRRSLTRAELQERIGRMMATNRRIEERRKSLGLGDGAAVNVPLKARGDINAQIDAYKREQAREARKATTQENVALKWEIAELKKRLEEGSL